jgi:hypothetical protein
LSPSDTRTRVWFEHGHIVREHAQPNRRAVLREVQTRRDNPGTVRDLAGIGRPALTIPELDWIRITRANPDLKSPDAEIKTKAWLRFIQSSESFIYRNMRRP